MCSERAVSAGRGAAPTDIGRGGGAVADEEPELVRMLAEGHQVAAGCLRGPGPVGVWGAAEYVDVAGADLDHEEHVGLGVVVLAGGVFWRCGDPELR
ncbi:hypothetical protein ACQEUX_02875 [Micromonospora sp. CA-259024]|uniref:hypothetical protein n=1 Tax=Micromonospora sp. CA-259024 TaxID=3239965 RepID=UPI003D8CE359